MRNIPYYKIAITLIFSLFSLGSWAQTGGEKNGAEQGSVLRFDSENWDFGSIKEDGGSVKHSFTFKNQSEKPVVILDVTTGCGCTTPTYSRKPVMPQASGQIEVEFDPVGRPGKFVKGVVVYTSAQEKPFQLTISGDVVPRPKTMEELYPFDMGQGVRLSANFHAFAYVNHGKSVKQTIAWINNSSKDLTFELKAKERSGFFSHNAPKVMKAGGKGEFTIGYTLPAKSTTYGSLSDVYSVVVQGVESRALFSSHAIAVDNFDAQTEDMSVPCGEFTKKFIKFGDVKSGEKVKDSSIEVENVGEKPLIIRAVELQSKHAKCSLKPGDRIEKGAKLRLTFEFDSSDCDYGIWVDRVKIITNDPTRPMQTLRLTAIVVEK